jgi:hypothetical protein
VIEHFTNNNEQQARNIELNNVYPLAQTHQVDLVDVHYHTVFPDPDPLNKDYPAGPNARSAFYGVSGVPFTLLDGNYGKYNYDEGNALSENDLLRRILMDPQFQIDPVVEIAEGLVKTETQITALKDLGNSDISVYTMILEKSVSAENWGGGSNDIYRNVVKTILPDPGGKRYVRSWTSGEKVNLVQAWEIENVYNTDSLMTVVFVQNNTTKEIYQTGIASIGSVDTTIATSIQPMQTEQYTYTVFPNPVSEKVNVLFDKMPPVELTVRIYNNLGELILSQQMHETGLRKILDVHELHEGIYFLQLHSGDQLIGVEKLFIMKN